MTTKFELEVESEEELRTALKNMPWLKCRPSGFVSEANTERRIEGGYNAGAGARTNINADVLTEALSATSNKTEAAKFLGITRATLYALMRKHNINTTESIV